MNTRKMVDVLAEIFADDKDIEWWKRHLKVSTEHRNVVIEINHINDQDNDEILQALVDENE